MSDTEIDWDAKADEIMSEDWWPSSVDEMWGFIEEGLYRKHSQGVVLSETFQEAMAGCGYLLVSLALTAKGVSLDTLDLMFIVEHHFKFTYDIDTERFGIDVIFDEADPLTVTPADTPNEMP